VLPFENMSDDPEQEYFADGIVEEIITALSRFRQLFVIARNSSFAYKGRSVDVKQIGRDLGVRYVLEGSVRKAASRLRITAQLIDTSTGTHLWADRFEGTLEAIFELQDQVTTSVVGAIAPQVEKAEIERAKRKLTDSLDAYDCFLRGMASFHRPPYANREAIAEALAFFKRAIELDPDFASAYAMGGYCYVRSKVFRLLIDPAKETAEAGRLAQRAMELGRDDALAVGTAGMVFAYVVRDLDVSAALIDRALVLNPNLAPTWFYSGLVKLWLGEPDAAIEHFARAMRLSPVDHGMPSMQAAMADALIHAKRYDEASTWAAMAIREAPNYHNGLRAAAASNALAGRLELAQKATAQLRQLDPALRVSMLKGIQGPYRRLEDIARYEEGMRKAGLPE
jgi:TolB-like protein